MTLALTAGLVVLAALLAREALPRHRLAPVLAAVAMACIPATIAIGTVFHPDPLFAVLTLCALLVLLRARSLAWPRPHALVLGALLGVCALTRQSALLIVVSLAVGALLLGHRRAVRFVVLALVAAFVTAGPWWGYQVSRYGNPIQSNLDRPGYMLDRQPLSFFVSLPFPEVVTHPYRESFKNELLPKFHAELWSDWFGAIHDWTSPSRATRVLASTQSVLGFGGDALVLWGLFAAGIPAAWRAFRAPPATGQEAALVAMTTLFVLAWLAFVVMLVRFPQADGDPIKAHYMLFLGPVSCVFGTVAALRAWRRGAAWRVALLSWAGLYALSYGATLWVAF
jgi:4-amino-4-deoxy-L-arabinose transferase-like glycosyltransferase